MLDVPFGRLDAQSVPPLGDPDMHLPARLRRALVRPLRPQEDAQRDRREHVLQLQLLLALQLRKRNHLEGRPHSHPPTKLPGHRRQREGLPVLPGQPQLRIPLQQLRARVSRQL